MFRFKLVVFGPMFKVGHFQANFFYYRSVLKLNLVVFGPIFKIGVDFGSSLSVSHSNLMIFRPILRAWFCV